MGAMLFLGAWLTEKSIAPMGRSYGAGVWHGHPRMRIGEGSGRACREEGPGARGGHPGASARKRPPGVHMWGRASRVPGSAACVDRVPGQRLSFAPR